MEVGGKRTIKYQNTSYGIDMQMLGLLLLTLLMLSSAIYPLGRGKQALADAAIVGRPPS